MMKINNSLSIGPLLVGAIALSIGMPVSAQAQEMTRAQQEVWEWEQGCWATDNTLEDVMACFHEDFFGWGSRSSVPSSKATRRVFFARFFETSEAVFQFLNPLSVKVRDDMAVIIYLATYTTRNRRTDEETTVTERWTDIAIREGGRWYWIADHGTRVPSN